MTEAREPTNFFNLPERASITVEAPAATVPSNLVTGVYANQATIVTSSHEVVLDFSVVVPTSSIVNAQGNLENLTIAHLVVSRVLMPIDQFNSFMIAYVRKHPELMNAITPARGEESL